MIQNYIKSVLSGLIENLKDKIIDFRYAFAEMKGIPYNYLMGGGYIDLVDEITPHEYLKNFYYKITYSYPAKYMYRLGKRHRYHRNVRVTYPPKDLNELFNQIL